MATYPSEFPLDSVKSIINIFRSGGVADNKELLAYDIWVVQGYAQKMLMGDLDISAFAAEEALADTDAIDELEKAAAKFESGDIVTHAAVPWLFILKWALKILINSL